MGVCVLVYKNNKCLCSVYVYVDVCVYVLILTDDGVEEWVVHVYDIHLDKYVSLSDGCVLQQQCAFDTLHIKSIYTGYDAVYIFYIHKCM